MSASAALRTSSRPAAATAGALYGLALARFLFELSPLRLHLLGTWPGAAFLGVVGLALGAALGLYARRLNPVAFPYAPWAPLALALPVFGLIPPDVNPLRSITLLLGAVLLTALLLFSPAGEPLEPPSGPDILPRTAASPPPSTIVSRILPFCLFFLLFLLYLRTLAPAVGQADTFEFQVGVARLGIAHGSGYPLLMLIGRMFTLLPVGGTLAFRANLTSAFFGALAAVGVERLSRRLGAAPLVAALAGLAFGVSPTFWSRAVEIEAYTLNAAFVAALLYLSLGFLRAPPPAIPGGQPKSLFFTPQSRLMLLGFLFGLSLTNHLTTLLLAPACLAAVLLGTILIRPRNTPEQLPTTHQSSLSSVLRPLFLVVFSLLVGLSIYLYLPLRWPAINHGQPLSLAGFTNIITGNEAKGAFQWRLPFQDLGRYPIVWSKIAAEYSWPGLALAVLGVASLLWPKRRANKADLEPKTAKGLRFSITDYNLHLNNYELPITNYAAAFVLLLAYLGYGYFALAFNVPDPDFSAFFIPIHLIAAVLMALGLQSLLNLLTRQPLITRASAGVPAPARTSHHLQSLAAPSRSIPLGHLYAPKLVFSCLLLSAFCLLSLRSIWTTFPLEDRSGNWSGQRLGELMLEQPLTHGAAILADSEKIAPLDYLQIAEGRRPDLDIVVLPDEASYRAALDERLAAGQVVYLGRYLPGLGAAYSLRSVGPLAEVSPQPFTSTDLQLQPAVAQPAVAAISLVGYVLPNGASAAAPSEFDLTLVWRAPAVPADNLLVNLRLVDRTGQPAWQNSGTVPVDGLYPTNAWRAGEMVSDFYRVPVDAGLAPGAYQLQVALLPPFAPAAASDWTPVAPLVILPPAQAPTPPHQLRDQFGADWLFGYDVPEAVAPGSHFALTLYWLRTAQSITVTTLGETHSLAAWPVGAIVPIVYRRTAPTSGNQIDLVAATGTAARCGWVAPATNACALPSVRLAGQAAAQGAIIFDNQILLNRASLATPTVTPGGRVSVNLEWQALRSIKDDYTVFVHLLGPDGLVHGQVDSWPVSGTRATSSWTPGEPITDPYTVQVPPDAPPGPYTIEIGLYLLASGERLPVLNADGVPIDNRLLLRGLLVNPP